jgi:hypothetical protein
VEESLLEVLGVVLGGDTDVDLLLELDVDLGLDDGGRAIKLVLEAGLNK